MKKSIFHSIPLLCLSFSLLFFLISPVNGQVVINELVSSNQEGLPDEDGDFPDWIELYNAGDEPVDLTGFGISDDPEDPFQWEFPETELAAGGYYLLFASDKNHEGFTAYWETVVRQGDSIRYHSPSSLLTPEWVQPDFNDSAWGEGTYGIGYGDGDDATETNIRTVSVFTRSFFNLEDPENVKRMLLHIDFDDGYIAYLNGEEISRENMNGSASNNTATTDSEALLYQGQSLSPIPLHEFTYLLKEGKNVLAIQVHNVTQSSSDLSLIPFLSIGRTVNPEETRGVANETNLELTQLTYPHTNFKLSSDGETVVLTHPDETVVDSVSYPPLNPDESYGRSTDDPENWVIFTETTPMEANSADGFAERLTVPPLTNTGGFYNGSVSVGFANSSSDNIYYTTDGSVPGKSDLVFSPPYTFDETTVLRLRAIQNGRLSSDVETYTYFVDVQHELPVISMVAEPDLWESDERGIYVRGTNGITGNCENFPANWNQDWEIPAHMEFYEKNQSLGFSSNIGTKIFGGCSRQNPQKSLSVFFRGNYGNPELQYKLFEEKDIDTFQAFILRNGGNDFGGAHLRDAMMTTLIEDHTKLDYQAYQPVVMYRNGEYWGIHNVREKINEHFVASNHNVDSDDIDLIENNGQIKHGESDAYNAMIEAFGNADMETEAGYQSVLQYVDVESFIDYQVSEIFFANQDWPGNNVRYWRERRDGAKFRWIIYDTDFGFNLYGNRPPEEEMMNFATDGSHTDPDYWPNPAWSTYMFRKLLENESFQHAFVNRFADLLNTTFSADHIVSVIDSLAQRIEPEIGAHQSRWNRSVGNWENQINVLKNFGENRQGYIASQVINYFDIEARNPVTVEASAGGQVQVNRVIPDSYPWTGEYFGGLPVTISALPAPGYRFTGWSGSSSSTSRDITIQAEDRPDLTATFEELPTETSEIVINEIMYNAPDEEDPEDWIELYNPNDFAMNIGGWTIKDDDDEHTFILPENTLIAETGYLVISQNLGAFQEIYGSRNNVIGSMDFGLGGGGDQVRVYDQNGILVDSLEYTDEAPWPLEADGGGYSLELTDPSSDNALAENWAASVKAGGTPGSENRIATSSEEELALPSAIALEQNYPNPFNPNTNITYHLKENSLVSLDVFDVLGRKVATLVNGRQSAGTHHASFDAGNLASGVYMYRLQAGETVLIKKMLLAK
ncbi:CotH kinase family protein [Gracilimonas mengyeensis]|uniref:Por secretion system C-terminal sorting domain-containing protein n=1 Tax=Gracilimonas mengyeensis TaxID=1302730 RepID=A0A521E6Z6_9BACT|nr:CotH kinase family protein [Gracilimonas mengyeensis]SMO78950.1 Por secretion system C-terminal sorting domain-containing protein [Gracilimonas mengyeensis]